jgi:hypothetical protein
MDIPIKRIWVTHPEKLKASLEACGIYKQDICAIWIGKSELVIRKHWNGDITDLQNKLNQQELTKPLTVRFETFADVGEQLGDWIEMMTCV